jgi:15,16-dihydrobiliverdin:ferredoxin oxidoreductase
MSNDKTFTLRFNQILHEEMEKEFEVKSLPLDPDIKIKHSTKEGKGAVIQNEYLACSKCTGIRMGEMNFADAMMVHFGNIPPGKEYNFPIFGFTFAYASKFLICVLDLHPLSRDKEYMDKYIEPLKDVSKKYAWIPKEEGGRDEVHEWAKFYDSGYAFYRWCDGKYLSNVEEAFRDYLHVFRDCIRKAEPLTEKKAIAERNGYMEKYSDDYIREDPGNGPVRTHYGEEWGEKFLKTFLFAP